MILISIKKSPLYFVNKGKLRKEVTTLFKKRGIISNAKVSIALIDEKKMLDISRKYLKDNRAHNVLSFTESEVVKNFKYPPKDKTKNIGEILICYPIAKKEAKELGIPTNERVIELAKHGSLHLLGIHHD